MNNNYIWQKLLESQLATHRIPSLLVEMKIKNRPQEKN